MRIARECLPYLGVGLVVGTTGVILGYPWLGAMALALSGFVVYFFRDPYRPIPSEPDLLVSPADGKVTEISPLASSGGTRISIFLSLFDVHINRSPVSGRVQKLQYRPGRFLPANLARSGLENERNDITIASRFGSVEVAQIAGVMARRIICWKDVGDELRTGDRIGLIQFGSRVEVLLPIGIEPLVEVGMRVKGGATRLARVQPTAAQGGNLAQAQSE